QLEAVHRAADTASRQDAKTRAGLEEQLRETRGLLDLAMADAEQLRRQIEGGASEGTALKAELSAARAAQEHSNRQLAAPSTLRADLDRVVTLLDESVDAVDGLAAATTVAELLAGLVNRLSGQFSRVALFRVKGNRLEGEYQAGFDQTTDVSKLVIPMSMDSMLTRVVSVGAAETLGGDQLTSRGGTPFGGTPAVAVALPIVLLGETLGVVYADHQAANPSQEMASLAFAKLLIGQSVVLLTRHTHELKTLAEMREYAIMLLQEAEHMYAADAEADKTAAELRKR